MEKLPDVIADYLENDLLSKLDLDQLHKLKEKLEDAIKEREADQYIE